MAIKFRVGPRDTTINLNDKRRTKKEVTKVKMKPRSNIKKVLSNPGEDVQKVLQAPVVQLIQRRIRTNDCSNTWY